MKKGTHAGGDGGPLVVLCLYVAGSTPQSMRALVNVRRYCEQHLKEQYELFVVDVREHPEVAQREQLIALPTLVRKLPAPEHRMIGDLSDRVKLEHRLHLQHPAHGS
jgi:circadian clock protein KaiB